MRLDGLDLACIRGGRTVFEGVSFGLDAGEALAVTGRNGAGKSTLLRLIAGLLPRAAGSLTLQGADPDTPIGEAVHYIGHAEALKPALTVLENLAFWQRFYRGRALDPVDALARFRIDHLADLPAAYLSAGQKRRLGLARLLVAHRPLWLLDEPTSALDAATQRLFATELEAHLAAGGLVVAATHGDLGIAPARTLEIAG